MFGHDNQDDDKEKGHITLPTAGGFGQDEHKEEEAVVVAPAGVPEPPADGDLSAAAPANNARKTEKSGAPTDDLLDIKQEALQALTPLVDHLEQSPEEKFRTTMMMIQASDNHSLIKVAYDAAQQIADEKERAQALLDIVNEINYFTQHNAAA
jgi:hypothetical protein